jgi:hypothetical protein
MLGSRQNLQLARAGNHWKRDTCSDKLAHGDDEPHKDFPR